MHKTLADFLTGNEDSISLPMVPIKEIEAALHTFGFNELKLNGGETNGWQIDFWYTFIHPQPNQASLELTGSLFYGDYTLTKNKD